MVNLLDLSGTRFLMHDTSGNTIFDTEERLFTVTDFGITGSIQTDGYTARNRNVTDTYNTNGGSFVAGILNIDTSHTLTTGLNTAADTVRGAFSVATAAGTQGGVTGLGFFNASGTYLHYMDGISTNTPTLPAGSKNAMRVVAAYTFLISSGTLSLHERVYIQADIETTNTVTNSITLLRPTFTYNVFVGVWV